MGEDQERLRLWLMITTDLLIGKGQTFATPVPWNSSTARGQGTAGEGHPTAVPCQRAPPLLLGLHSAGTAPHRPPRPHSDSELRGTLPSETPKAQHSAKVKARARLSVAAQISEKNEEAVVVSCGGHNKCHLPRVCACAQSPSSNKDACPWTRPTLIQCDLILIPSQRPYFQVRLHSQVHEFWGGHC